MNESEVKKGSLQRTLGLFPLTNIVVANMVGAGIFTTSGLLMRDLGSPLVMIFLWVAGGAIALCGALSYGELAAAIPEAGGEYVFLSRLYHPLFGFLSGWVSFFVGFSAPIAASAIGFSEYLTRAFPVLLSLKIAGNDLGPVFVKKALGCAVIVLFTLIHAQGIRFGSRVQSLLTVMKVGLVLGLVAAGFALGKGNWEHFGQGEIFHLGLSGWKSAGLALMWIMFAYSGWNASAYIGSEVKNPATTMPRSLILGTGIVITLYAGLNLLYVYSTPPDRMSGVISIGGLAVGNLFGKSFESFVSVLISFALFSSLSAYIILGPRVYYSMAADGLFFKFASRVHRLHRAPTMSIILQCLISVVILLSGSFDKILTYMGFSLGIFPILAVLGVFKLRTRGMLAYRMPGFPVVPVFYVLTGVLILVLGFLQSPGPSLVALGTVALGVPAYFMFKTSKDIRGGLFYTQNKQGPP